MAATLASGAIRADAIAANAITATAIADDAITAAKLNTGALTADAFAADAIVAATLATGAITADAFAADAIVAATLATGALTADAFAANALVAATFAADCITEAKIADNAIAAEHLAANAIDFATFAADCKTGTGLKANVESITANAITATAINADAITEAKIADAALSTEHFNAAFYTRLGIVAYGTAQAAAGTSIQLAAASAFADDELNGAIVVITGGTGVGQSRLITDYVSTTDTATVDTWTTTPSGTITYVVFAAAPASVTSPPAVNVTQVAGTTQAAGDLATLITTVDTVVDAVKVKTDYLPSVTAGGAGGVFIAGSNAATSITTALTANVTGNLSGTVGSVTGAVGSVTGAVGSVAGNVGGNVVGSVGSVASGGITAASIATGAIDADALAADAVDEILDEVIEGSVTMRQALRLFMAALGGKVSGAGTTSIMFRDTGDTTNRIAATVDSSGNRTAVTLTLT